MKTNTHTQTTQSKSIFKNFFKMLPLNKESKLQMKIDLPFYISLQQNYPEQDTETRPFGKVLIGG